MANIFDECKQWISLLQKLELDTIIKGLKSVKNTNQNAETNKYLFKLLLHLSHCARRCHKEQLSKENEIFTITVTICDNLTKVPDKNNFFSALFFIIYYFLNKKCLKEAKVITSYLCPGKMLDVNDSLTSVQYEQIMLVWQTEIYNTLERLTKNSKAGITNTNEDFSNYIQFHLQFLCWCDKSLVFKTAQEYTRKLTNLPLTVAFPVILELFKQLSSYVKDLKKCSVEEVYNIMIYLIGTVFYSRKDTINNANAINYFRQCDFYFLEYIKSETLSHYCYRLFREYSINLFETNYMTNGIGELRFKKSLELLKNLLKQYGANNNILIQTVASIALSFDSLFSNLENSVVKQMISAKVTCDDIVNIGNFVKYVHRLLKNSIFPTNYVCTKCSESTKCSIKKSIYNASRVIDPYLRIITKMNLDLITEPIFALAKELIEELISTFNELDNSGCKYAIPMWATCGRSIFNIGLITEVKYPAGLQKIYEILCRQVVRHDGVNSQVSSFGLENPVSSALSRLCKLYFYQEKYRTAMSYAAYAIFFSNQESRRKKAYDMWAQIKTKLPDSNEIQELTILQCLKMDIEVVKKLGIYVDPKTFDVNDLCIRELKSLFSVRSNLMISMKKTLTQLESTNSGLHYAQGVLFLCFHALEFNKRDVISDYISKAIVKLKPYKSKSLESQCLLANLKFFKILESLYERSQAINKQIDDAKFTIKAFKSLKGRPWNGETEEKEEVVPTFGGINIEEDNKYYNQFRGVLISWENTLGKNIATMVKGNNEYWEPKFTLETIILCGEYCRLYKYGIIEERFWKLAHELATALQDFTTCVYVTSRSISLRHVNETWVKNAEGYVEKIVNSNKIIETDVVILFWLSLIDFYCDCKKIEEAKVLLEKVKMMPNWDLLSNPKLFIYYTDIQFRNYYLINTNTSQEEYCQLIVQIHYLMIHLEDWLNQGVCKFWNVRFQLFTLEQLFETMCSVAIPMNSLLSYREVSQHLLFVLKWAQCMGTTLRIAEYLKYLCYIDLLRTHVEECEARLQDLEHILCLERFHMSMKAKIQEEPDLPVVTTGTVRDASAVINAPKNRGSPELKKKIFSSPNFLIHTNYCQCFFCTNIDYQYLTFSSTHLRAQLYSLLKFTKEAEQYFHGACKIKLRAESRDSEKSRQYNNYKWKRSQTRTIDVMLYMLDFSMHLIDFKPDRKESALAIIEEVQDIAAKNDLSMHCTNVYATELYFQEFYNAFQDKLCISVPLDIPITITNQPVSGCITPKQQPIEKPAPNNARRRKSPPAVGIPVITITDDSPLSEKSDLSSEKLAQPAKRTSARNVRRKILVDEPEESATEKPVPTVPVTRKRSTRLAMKSNDPSVS